MKQQHISIDEAQNNLLACAAFLAERIGSSDGHAEAVKSLVPYYLAKDEVDTAAEMADAVEDPFVRDQLLAAVAEKCAEIDDDEYALQLADAIEDSSFQGVAFEQIARQKAQKKQFAKAFEIAESLEHASNAYAEIAARQEVSDALQTIEKIEFPYTKVQALMDVAHNSNDLNLLERATEMAKEIEFAEERIRAYLSISFQYIEASRKDKAIEVLATARQFAETLDSVQKETFLSQISQGFMRAGTLDLADRTLDLVADKYEIAQALVGYADEFKEKGEDGESFEALEEAYQILKSQRETETRNTKAKFNLFGSIAIRFASFGKPERGIEIAGENPYDEIRNNSLTQIAVICATKGNDEMAHQAIKDMGDEAEKSLALIALSDVKRKDKQNEESLNLLSEAYSSLHNFRQPSMKSLILNRLAERFSALGENERARQICSESLQSIEEILDESHRVSALAGLSDTFSELDFALNEAEKDILRTMIRKTAW